jgi:hypothetical protein
MFATTSANITRRAERLMVDLAWTQWSALSTIISARTTPARATIDPEALVILSVLGERYERRLRDVVMAWTIEGIRFISLQRARSLADRLPAAFGHIFATFAEMATEAGDHRWKRYLATTGRSDAPLSRGKTTGPIRLDAAPAIMLRLRAGFGVGAKADILATLLGVRHPVTLKAISHGLGYGTRPLRVAIDDMVTAGFVERIETSPITFRAPTQQWDSVLNRGLNEVAKIEGFPSAWLPWADVAVFLACLLDWSQQATASNWSEYIAASRARDVVDRHVTPAMVQTMSLRIPAEGETTDLDSFDALLSAVDAQVRENW